MAKSKKELDKDLMFSKIIPALSSNPFCSDTSVDKTNKEDSPCTLTGLRDKIFAQSSVSDEPEKAVIVNVMENLVSKNVDSVIQRFNVCSCDRCRLDICAYALNLLPPKYVVVQPSKMEAYEKKLPIKQVVDALIKAALQVRSNPRH